MTRKTTQRLRKAVLRLDGLPIMPEYLLTKIDQPELELDLRPHALWTCLPLGQLGLPKAPAKEVHSHAFSALVAVIDGFASDIDHQFHHAFWKHGLACAAASLKIAQVSRLFHGIDPVVLFCAATLHDIGKLVLQRVDAQAFQDVTDLAKQRSMLFCDAERDLLGVVHNELGGHFADAWHLPESVRAGIGLDIFKPDRLTESDRLVVVLVRLGNFFANHLGAGFTGNGTLPAFPSDWIQRIGIGQAQVNEIITSIQDTLPRLEKFLNLSASLCADNPKVYSVE